MKLFRPITVIIIAASSIVCSARGSNARESEITEFDRALHAIAANNPDIRRAVLSAQADVAEAQAENALAAPEVEFGYLFGEGATGDKWNISVSQSFDWPGVYAARRSRAKAVESASEFAVQSTVADRLLAIKMALIDLVNARKYRAATSEMADTIERLYQITLKGVESGDISRLDLNKLAIERVNSRRELLESDRAVENCMATLTQFNGGTDCSGLVASITEYPDEPLHSAEHYRDLVTTSNPTLIQARHNAEAAQLGLTAARRAMLPGLSVGYNYENEGAERWHGFSIGISLPFLTGRKATKAARLRAQEAELDALQLQSSQLAEVESERTKALSYLQEVQILRPLMEDSNNLRMLHRAYTGGQITLLEYLLEANYFLSAYRDMLQAEYLYHLSAARLNRLTIE